MFLKKREYKKLLSGGRKCHICRQLQLHRIKTGIGLLRKGQGKQVIWHNRQQDCITWMVWPKSDRQRQNNYTLVLPRQMFKWPLSWFQSLSSPADFCQGAVKLPLEKLIKRNDRAGRVVSDQKHGCISRPGAWMYQTERIKNISLTLGSSLLRNFSNSALRKCR